MHMRSREQAAGRDFDNKTVVRWLKVKADFGVTHFLRGGHDSAPDLLYLFEIKFGGHAQAYAQRPGLGHNREQLSRYQKHGLAAEMLQGKIYQVEVQAFQQQGRGRNDAVSLSGLEIQRVLERTVRSPFVELPERLNPAQL